MSVLPSEMGRKVVSEWSESLVPGDYDRISSALPKETTDKGAFSLVLSLGKFIALAGNEIKSF